MKTIIFSIPGATEADTKSISSIALSLNVQLPVLLLLGNRERRGRRLHEMWALEQRDIAVAHRWCIMDRDVGLVNWQLHIHQAGNQQAGTSSMTRGHHRPDTASFHC